MNFNENDLWRDKNELLNLRFSKLPCAKVLYKLESDTKGQVLYLLLVMSESIPRVSLCCSYAPDSVHHSWWYKFWYIAKLYNLHDLQLTLRPRGVDNVHISQCLHPVFMRHNITVENLVGFALGAEVHHVPQTTENWSTSWSTAYPATAGITRPFQQEWKGPFHSSQNVMGNTIPARME